MREVFKREIPTLGFKSMQDYILHEDSNYAVLITNDKEKVIDRLEKEITCQAKIRSTQSPTKVTISPQENDEIYVKFEDMQKSIAPGQSVVLYDGDIVLGGGIIKSH